MVPKHSPTTGNTLSVAICMRQPHPQKLCSQGFAFAELELNKNLPVREINPFQERREET